MRVLLVEDEPEHANLIGQMLALSSGNGAGFEMVHCGTVESGTAWLLSAEVDVVLLDLGLPDSSGVETFYRVHSGVPELPIIVLSGESDEALALETVQRGAQDYLVKGRVDRFALARAIEYAIERKRVQVELRHARDEMEERVKSRTAELAEANARLGKEIAERRRAEAALRESNQQLEHAVNRLRETQESVIQRERLLALGQMASGIAHDFNNALSPVLGFSDLLLLKPELLSDIGRARGYLEMIRMAARDGAGVVARLRDFYRSREESEPFCAVGLDMVVTEVIALTEPRWRTQAHAEGKMIRIDTDFETVPPVNGNAGELREMLMNVVFNAVDAIEADGVIGFRLRHLGGRVVLEIRDDGSGMAESVRQRCMEPFFSTKKEQGTGLGLGIVYGIITRHDGTIEIESREGEGTTVSVSLPGGVGGGEEPAEERNLSASGAAARVLVVEDDPLVREVLEVYLTGDGHEVVVAEDGLEGLERFCEGTFDLVLTDRAMPEMNGDQLAAAIKERSPGTPVILLTGFGDLMQEEEETVEGVDCILSKPFTMESLRGAISSALSR